MELDRILFHFITFLGILFFSMLGFLKIVIVIDTYFLDYIISDNSILSYVIIFVDLILSFKLSKWFTNGLTKSLTK